jgi:hypothetical protein
MEHLGKTGKSFTAFPVGFNLNDAARKKEAANSDALLILTYPDFTKNLELLNNKRLKDKEVYVFAPVIRFRNISGVYMLDALDLEPKLNQPYRFITPNFDVAATAKPQTVEIKDEKYLPLLINNALTGSILTNLMTLIYKIPNGRVQNEYRDKIIGWFVLGDSKLATIKALIDTIKQTEVRDNLYKLVKASKNYKDVFNHIAELNRNKKPISYSKIAEKMNVNEFDLRYMISVASKLDFGANLEDKDLADHYFSHDRNASKRKVPETGEKRGKTGKTKSGAVKRSPRKV